MEKNTLIFLMDMDGHRGLCDDFAHKYRTYALQDIVNDSYLCRDKNIIVSTLIYSQTSKDLHHQATYDRGWKWYFSEKDKSFRMFVKQLRANDFKLEPERTTVIFGGTNTSGCVLNSAALSMNKFVDNGFYCQLYLPLCDDVMMPGIGSHDRSQKAFSEVYDFIKKNNLWNKIDVTCRFTELDLKKSNFRFEYMST